MYIRVLLKSLHSSLHLGLFGYTQVYRPNFGVPGAAVTSALHGTGTCTRVATGVRQLTPDRVKVGLTRLYTGVVHDTGLFPTENPFFCRTPVACLTCTRHCQFSV